MAKLDNPKHELFAKEYLKELNASKSYLAVYGKSKGYETSASKLLKNPKVNARVKELIAKREAKAEIKAFDVIKELEKLAKARIIDVFDINDVGYVTIKSLDDIPEECQSAIESIESISLGGDKGVLTKVKFHSKIKALELLGKHHGLFTDKLEIGTKPKTIEELVKASKGK